MLYQHTNATIDEKLKNYIDGARYDRERIEHKQWGDKQVNDLSERLLRVEVAHAGIKDKIEQLATQLAAVSEQVKEMSKKLDQMIGIRVAPAK